MDYLDCKICNEAYDEEDHRPRNAPCGHELCSVCLASLIGDGVFECPKCRHKSNVSSPDDLPVSFGLIDVIRALKSTKISSTITVDSRASGATNGDVCDIHCKPISHWCNKCILWICKECLETHTELIGCSTNISTEVIGSMKERHIKGTDILMTVCDEDVKCMSLKKQEFTKIVEKLDEKLQNWTAEGNDHMEKLKVSKVSLSEANSPSVVLDRINVLTQRKKILHSWFIKNIGIDSPLGLSQALKEGEDVYTEKIIKGFRKHAKLTQHEQGLFVHPFQTQAVADSWIVMPFDRLQNMIPEEVSLVFMELSIGSDVKGNVLIRLDTRLPNIREHMVQIFTGLKGPSMKDVKFVNACRSLYTSDLSQFEDIPVSPDCSGSAGTFKRGDVLADYSSGYISQMFFPIVKFEYTNSDRCIIGQIEEGLDIIQEFYTKHPKISDCGLVTERD